MEKSKSISSFQLFSMLFLSSLFSAMMYSEYTVENPDLLSYAAACLVSAAVLCLVVIPLMLFRKRSEDGNIIKAVQIKRPVLSGVYSAAYMIYFIYSSVVSLVLFSFMLGYFVNQGISFVAFFAITLCCCYYSAYKGLFAIGRAAAVFFVIIFILILSSLFSISFRINPLNYSYMFVENADGVFDNMIHIIALNSAIPAIYLFVNKVKGNLKRSVFTWILVSGILLSVISLASFGVLGEYYSLSSYPFYTATQLIEVGAFQRLDALFLALWTVGMFVNVSMSLYALREVVQSTFRAEKVRFINPASVTVIGAAALTASRIEPLKKAVFNIKILFVLYIAAAIIFPVFAVLALRKSRRPSRRKVRRTAAGTAVLILGVLCISALTGCQMVPIQDRMFVKGVGIDKQGEEYAVTVQYIDNYSDGEKQQNKCLQVTGKSVGEAIGKIKNSSGSEPFLGQNVAMVVGWETSKGDMEAILDYFVRYIDTRPTVKLYVSETTAEDILTLEVAGSLIPIDHLTSISPSNSKNDNKFTVLNFINQTKNPTDTPTATVLRVDENAIKLSSVVVFGGEENVYMLDENGYITYKTLIGIDNGTVLSFEGISATVTDCNTNVLAREKNGELDFDVSCRLGINVIENPKNISDEEIVDIFDRELLTITNNSVKEALVDNGCDIYSLGRHLKFGDYEKYSDESLYRESLKSCSANVTINCEIAEISR